MSSGATVFAALSILAGVVALACRTMRPFTVRLRGAGPIDAGVSGTLDVTARLSLGFSCLFAVAAFIELWLELRAEEGALRPPLASAWGALWVYAFMLLAEWRFRGLLGAGRRALAGLFLAGAGVLLLGIALDAWTSIGPPRAPECPDGNLAIDATAPVVVVLTALGLALVPLASAAVRLEGFRDLPFAAAAASVAIAIWLQPLLPPLGWLPTSLGAGAALALLLVVALLPLGSTASRGPRAAVVGLSTYFALSVGGCIVLGTL